MPLVDVSFQKRYIKFDQEFECCSCFKTFRDRIFFFFSNNAVMDPKENDSVKSKMSHSKVFCKKEIVKYFVKHTGKILCRSPYFIELLVFSQQFIKKETPAQTICLKIWKKINNKSFTELELQMNSSGRVTHFSKNESNSYCQYF